MVRKLLFAVLVVLLFAGCEGYPKTDESGFATDSCGRRIKYVNQSFMMKDTVSFSSSPVWVVDIDSCEYVIVDRGITHKGNCKFCRERVASVVVNPDPVNIGTTEWNFGY